MKCNNCGAELEKGAKFCDVCGTPVPEEQSAPAGGGYTPGADSSASYVPGGASAYTPGADAQSSYTPGADARRSYAQSSYTPGTDARRSYSNSSYTPGADAQSSYTPGSYIPGGSGGRASGVNTSHIREYFFGRKYKWPYVLMVVGLLCTVFRLQLIGSILFLVGLIALLLRPIWSRFAGNPYEDEVDAAWTNQKAVMRKRGMEKLGLVKEEMSLISPLKLVGFGASPNETFTAARMQSAQNGKGWFAFLRGLFSRNKKNGTEDDPVPARKIGSDGRIRSILQEYTIYAFTENQVLVYSGDVDISTGLVYNEYTAECFYKDIEGIRFTESLYKVLNARKRRYESKVTNAFILYLGGCNFQCSVNNETDSTIRDEQFAAMRKLIRDKKNA